MSGGARTSVDACRCPLGAQPHGRGTGQPWSDPRSDPARDVRNAAEAIGSGEPLPPPAMRQP